MARSRDPLPACAGAPSLSDQAAWPLPKIHPDPQISFILLQADGRPLVTLPLPSGKSRKSLECPVRTLEGVNLIPPEIFGVFGFAHHKQEYWMALRATTQTFFDSFRFSILFSITIESPLLPWAMAVFCSGDHFVFWHFSPLFFSGHHDQRFTLQDRFPFLVGDRGFDGQPIFSRSLLATSERMVTVSR